MLCKREKYSVYIYSQRRECAYTDLVERMYIYMCQCSASVKYTYTFQKLDTLFSVTYVTKTHIESSRVEIVI